MLIYWIWLTTCKGLGKSAIAPLLSYFSTAEQIYFASESDFRQVPNLTVRDVRALSDKSLEIAEGILRQCTEKKISIVTYQDAAYPSRLRNIPQPPAVLYYVGTLPDFDQEVVISIVGTRKASGYGMMTAKRLGYQIASCGGVVVSGVALGIDTMAMIGAVSGGRTAVGVLGCGVDVVYPPSNKELFEDLKQVGCLLSEYPPQSRPERFHFPERNRILSGLALGIVVVEAPKKSGALITANCALEQGRDVFAVPGNIDVASCVGSNHLIRDGAVMVETGWDVMREYVHLFPHKIKYTPLGQNLTNSMAEMREHAEPFIGRVADGKTAPITQQKSKTKPSGTQYIDVQDIMDKLSGDEAAIITALQSTALSVDDLIESCQVPTGRVLASLTLLEVKGYVQRLPAKKFSLAEK